MCDTMKTRRSHSGMGRAVLLAALAAPALAACAPDRVIGDAPSLTDYRARHPVALAQAPISLDVLAAGGKLDAHGREQVRAFANEYRAAGGGPINLQAPAGPGAGDASAAVDAIRRELAHAGVAAGVRVSTYQPSDPSLASPIRLSYIGTKAVVRSRCGEWPRDLASGSSFETWQNQSYWNHGCAYQQMIASQVADPRDIATPRAEAPSDVAMRTRAIGKVREGVDPGTTWQIKNTSIGTVGAN